MDNSLDQLITHTQVVKTEAERLADLVPNPGVPNGTIWTDVHGQKVEVVIEIDEAGNNTGWHVKPVEETI